jgi:hypothetical protein
MWNARAKKGTVFAFVVLMQGQTVPKGITFNKIYPMHIVFYLISPKLFEKPCSACILKLGTGWK